MSFPLELSRDLYEFLARCTNPRFIETVRKDISKEDWQFEVVTSSQYIYCSQRRPLGGQTQQMRTFFTGKENSLFQIAGERTIGKRRSKRRFGWSLNEIKYFYMYLAKYQPLRGETYIHTPKKASKRKTKKPV